MIVYLVVTAIFWLNSFPLSKLGAGLFDTKGSGQLVFGTVIEYKKVFCLKLGEYFQVHQEDESRNTIDIDQTVTAIVLGPHYNLQGGYF